jgi:hypothetical protein
VCFDFTNDGVAAMLGSVEDLLGYVQEEFLMLVFLKSEWFIDGPSDASDAGEAVCEYV